MLEARALGVTLHGRDLLRDVDLVVTPGETLCVLGENGAGKTTLMRALAGDPLPRAATMAGDVWLAGRPVSAWPLAQRARLRAVLPQRPELAFAFTSREVAAMGRYAVHGTPAGQDLAIAEAALQLADAAHLADREVATLSGGEQARVHLAAALSQLWEIESESPRYLLLDEPTAALDLAHQHMVMETARSFSQARGIGTVAILHDLNLASLYADRVLVLYRGRVIALGPPAEVLLPDNIAMAFNVAAAVLPHPLVNGALIATAPRRPEMDPAPLT